MKVGVRSYIRTDISKPAARFGVRTPWRQTFSLGHFRVFDLNSSHSGEEHTCHTIIDPQRQTIRTAGIVPGVARNGGFASRGLILFLPYSSDFRNRRVLRVRSTTAIAAIATKSGHRMSRPMPLRKVPRMTTRK
jgi:hypothetical protein